MIPQSKKHKNTDKYRQAALHFQAHGKYTLETPGTNAYRAFWKEEARRSLEGFTAPDGDYIPGYFYFYLNYSPIFQVEKIDKDKKSEGQVQAKRVKDFPRFWDSDYDYFTYLDEAEKNGEHGCVLKARGRGYSYKGGSMLNRNYFLIPGSKSYAIASESEFLTKDGILTKAWDNMDFIDDNTPWAKRRHKKNTEMHRRASYLEDVGGVLVEKGYKSEIIGITLKDAPNKARGKRGKLILWEEGGQFPHLLHAWSIARPSMEQDGSTFGLMVAFGTGGSEEGDYASLEELFYRPEGHNVHRIPNIWDEGSADTECGFFVPQYANMEDYYDKEGNSDIEEAKARCLREREKVRVNTKDINALSRYIAERPLCPAEATLKISGNIFPQADLLYWERMLESDKKLNTGTSGFMFRDENGRPQFLPSLDAVPVTEFPLKKETEKTGCVTVYYAPHKIGGAVPEDLYYICHDPIGLDTAGGESLGAAYVMIRQNKFAKPDDCIVASYVGRPREQNDYNRQLFMLAEYYNAKISFESDRGNVIEYARNNKLLHLLQEEFAIYDKSGKAGNLLGRAYGISMNNLERKKQGVIYLKEWLCRPRGSSTDGRSYINLHLIKDIALLKELRKFDMDGNYDRVSALLIGMFYEKELLDREIEDNTTQIEDFFEKRLF